MKKLNVWLIVAASLLLAIAACNKDKKVKELDPAQAKVEIRNATQVITTNMDNMMATPAAMSLDFLAQLMDNKSWKSDLKNTLTQPGKITLSKVKNTFRLDAVGNPKNKEIGDFGEYRYNFTTGDFDLISPSTNKLKITYPANEQAYNTQQLNAEFLLDNLEYFFFVDPDGYEEQLPKKFNVSQKINNNTQMSGSYNATYNTSGTPTSVSSQMNMGVYAMQTSMSGSGVNYNTNMSFKESNKDLMGYDLKITYAANMEDVDKVNGYYLIAPLKVEGFMNMAAIENHMDQAYTTGNYDFNFLNSQIGLKLIQTEQNVQIGKIEFRLYTDPYDGEKYPSLAVIYSDGTFEWLENILESEGFKFKKARK